MKWGHAELLGLLWLLIPAAWLLWKASRFREKLLAKLAVLEVMHVVLPRFNPARYRRRAFLWLAAIGFMFIALARPQWGFRWEEVRRRGLDIVVVLDTSRSMLAEDIKPSRFQQAKWGIRDLVQRLRGDRIGLVAFAGSSFLQCPLTVDYAAFLMTLEDLYIGIIPRGGTDVAQALDSAIESFEDTTDSDRVIILVTDGEDHEGKALEMVDRLKDEEIRVFAIGVGTTEGELIPEHEQGKSGYYKDRQGHVVKSSLEEGNLEKIALASGGAYVRSAPGDFGLERIIDQGIARLKRSDKESRMVKSYEERFAWALGAALLLLLLEAAVSDRGSRKEEAS